MARQGRPVFKYNIHGKLIDSFPSIKEAAKSIRMSISAFREILDSEGFLGGYIYSWNENGIVPLSDNVVDHTKEMPWEKNGYFDPTGWRKSCLY